MIAGAGIAGLTTAIALQRAGIRVEIYEAATRLDAAGAGIWMAPNAMKIFDRLGIAGRITDAGMPLKNVGIFDHRLRPILLIPQDEIIRRHGFPVTAIHRGALQNILREALAPDAIHLGKKLVAWRPGEAVALAFADGSAASGEYLLGADGINSTVRKQLFGRADLRYSGTTCWRGVVDFELPRFLRAATAELWGRQLRIGIAEIQPGRVYWFAVKTAPRGERTDPETWKAELLRRFDTFADPVNALIAGTPLEQIVRNDLSDLAPVRPWSAGRVCLMGDAAHPMTPDMGQGGAQAVEDALVLSTEMQRAGSREEQFARFEARRFNRVAGMVKRSRDFNRLAHIRFGTALRNAAIRLFPVSLATRIMSRLYDVADNSS